MKRTAFYGGSFDPLHCGHLVIARTLTEQFGLDGFVFVPAFQAPHKRRTRPTPAIHRYTMLCLATQSDPSIAVSAIEIESPHRPYTYETLGRLTAELPGSEIFFVMGGDSWQDITTWREWEKVLTMSGHIVVTRPGYPIEFGHVTDEIRGRIVDLRGLQDPELPADGDSLIYITDAVNLDISATDIRRRIAENDPSWRGDVPVEVANYIEKYQIYT